MREILSWVTGKPLYRSETATTDRELVEEAVRSGASLNGASLDRASLDGASLNGASLDRASLDRASLDGANLNRANLNGASLNGASLNRASLTPAWFPSEAEAAKADIFAVLDKAPAEVPALLEAVRAGKVDGSIYEGACACLLGTIANIRGCRYDALGIDPDAGRPAEQWFTRLRPGHTPERNPAAAQVEVWITEWQARRNAAPEAP